jgi:hypothetical protein
MIRRFCHATKTSGDPCQQSPLLESDYCFWHDPDNAVAAAEARRLGGVRRKREGTLRGAYDFGPVDSVSGLRRILDIAIADTLSLDNSVARNRILVAIVAAGSNLLKDGELEARLEAVEAAMRPRLQRAG